MKQRQVKGREWNELLVQLQMYEEWIESIELPSASSANLYFFLYCLLGVPLCFFLSSGIIRFISIQRSSSIQEYFRGALPILSFYNESILSFLDRRKHPFFPSTDQGIPFPSNTCSRNYGLFCAYLNSFFSAKGITVFILKSSDRRNKVLVRERTGVLVDWLVRWLSI